MCACVLVCVCVCVRSACVRTCMCVCMRACGVSARVSVVNIRLLPLFPQLFVHPHNTYDADALKKILEEDLSKPPVSP